MIVSRETIPVAQLDLQGIGMKGLIVNEPLKIGVVREGNTYILELHVLCVHDSLKVGYLLQTRNPVITDGVLEILEWLRRDIENYESFPDEWLTAEGTAIKSFLMQTFRPDMGDYFNASALQRRLDQAELRAVAKENESELDEAREAIQADIPGKVSEL